MGSPEFRSDSEPIEPTDKSRSEQEPVPSIRSGAEVTRREALRATLRAAVLGVVGVTGLANAKDPDTVIANRTYTRDISSGKDRENHDRIMKLLVDGFAKEYSNLSPKEITDLANLCTESKHQNRFDALNILSTRKTEIEILEAEFVKDVSSECSRVRARCGSIQCDLTEKMGHVNKIADPIAKAAYLAFIIEQATRVGDKGMVSEASAALSSVKKNGIGLSTSSILRIKLDAITAAINPASNKDGKSITMSVTTRLDVARETLDHFIPEAINARDLSTAEMARAIMYSKFTSGINQREVPKVVELRKDISDASRKLYALRTVERAYNKERNSETSKLETAKSQSAAARWLMETGDWNAGCLHLRKSKELSANGASIVASNAADLDLVASAGNASASDLIKASNAWIYAGKSNPSSNKLYLKRVAEFAGKLKGMKGLKFEEDAAIGKIMQYLKRNGIGAIASTTKPKEDKILFAKIQTAIKRNSLTSSKFLGSANGKPNYECIPAKGGILVGIETYSYDKIIKGIRFIFNTSNGVKESDVIGEAKGTVTREIIPKGSRIIGLKYGTGSVIDGIQLMFIKRGDPVENKNLQFGKSHGGAGGNNKGVLTLPNADMQIIGARGHSSSIPLSIQLIGTK